MHMITFHDLHLFCLKSCLQCTIKNIPINAATVSTCDISPLLLFHFCQPVYFDSDDSTFSSDSIEETGRFTCISENAGHDITFSILNITTNKVISRSNISLEVETISPNLRTDILTVSKVVKSWYLTSAHL